ncbi:MAG: hypothetical protein AAB966_05805, partial [Patescibacteria group bacterium]
SPEIVTELFQTIWQVRQRTLHKKGIDLDLSVVDCPYTQEQLAQLEQEGRRVGYLPESLSTQQDRHLLALLWPQMRGPSVREGNTVANEVDRYGWFDYDTSINAPHRNITEDELQTIIESQGRVGMNATEYIIASQDSKFLTGQYLDEVSTYVRLLGSRYGGYVVLARFRFDGCLRVRSPLRISRCSANLGGRSVGFPPKI